MSIGGWWKTRRKREAALRAAFVKLLLKEPVKKVKFYKGNRSISLEFCDVRVRYPIRVQREVYVGHWGRRTGIRIDRAMLGRGMSKSFRALAVHEAIERMLVERYGLPVDREAHDVATAKERQYMRRVGGSWKRHQDAVYRVWKKRGGH